MKINHKSRIHILIIILFLSLFILMTFSCSKNSEGSTILHWAAYYGHTEIVKSLIVKDDIIINAANSKGETPLFFAIQAGNKIITELLLNNGGDIHFRNSDGMTSIHWAAYYGHTDILLLLLSKINDNAKKIIINSIDSKKRLPIHLAYKNEHEEIIMILLKAGSRANIKNHNEYSILHWACENGYSGMIKLLLEKEIDINALTKQGYAPIHIAADNGHEQIVMLLINNGADINIPWPQKSWFQLFYP